MASKKPTIILLDAHAIIHRAYHALPELTTPTGEPAGALYGLSAMLVKLAREMSPDYMVAAYDLPGPTHRHDVYKEYKGTRSKTEDALAIQLGTSRDVFEAFHVPIYEVPGFEADDVIGTLSTQLAKDYSVIIASGDMDTLQLVQGDKVKVLTLRKGLSDTVLYNEEAVLERYGFLPTSLQDYKGLRGDPSDNIIGIRGIGDKTATTLIAEFGTIEKMYTALEKDKEAFKKKLGVTERIANLLIDGKEEAEFSKVLATIRLDVPIEFKKEDADWKNDFDSAHTTTLFTKLGFRSLISRAEGLMKSRGEESKKTPEKKEESFAEPVEADPTLLSEASLMLWLVSSDITNPSLEDILNNTECATLEDAHTQLVQKIKTEKLEKVYEGIEKPLAPVIEKLNAHGVLVDKKYLAKLSKEYHTELDILSRAIYKHAGEEFNINSPKQLGVVLFEKLGLEGKRQKKTATGQFSTKESELVKLKEVHPIIESILLYRELQKLLSTYIDAIPPLLDTDNVLRTTFVQTGTTTGRLSSKEPNLQNIPIKSDLGKRIRGAFIAPKGKTLLALDYSQIELRLAAILSGDEKLKGVFIRGEDVHTAVAADVFGVSLDKVTYDMRRSAKVINFGILYGMGVNSLRAALGADRTEAQSYLNRYFELYPGLAKYLTETKASAARIGYVTTLFGRKRFFPGILSHLPQIRAAAERMAINAPMQGTQADIIKIAMKKIDTLIDTEFKDSVALVLQIHDELIFEVDDAKLKSFAKKAKEVMEGVLSKKETDGVPITVSSQAGPNWAELEELE